MNSDTERFFLRDEEGEDDGDTSDQPRPWLTQGPDAKAGLLWVDGSFPG